MSLDSIKGFFFTDEPEKFDPGLGENAPCGDGWANVHTWFDRDWYHWTSRITCELPNKRLGVLEVDAQTEQEAIEAALCCVGNLG